MEDLYNLIYNGKMLNGMDGYATSTGISMDTTDKPTGCAASYVMDKIYTEANLLEYTMPYFPDNVYKLSFQLKGNLSASPYESHVCFLKQMDNKGKVVPAETIISYNEDTTVTTLAQDLTNGQTKVYLTSVDNWNASSTNRAFGIIESAAYKNKRALVVSRIVKDSINTTEKSIELTTAWSGGTYKAGSMVKEFRFGSGYIYPFASWNETTNPYPTVWTGFETTLLPSTDPNSERKALLENSYFLGFGWLYGECKLADLRLENLSEPQARIPSEDESNTSKSSVNQYGQLNTGLLSEGFIPVRYIKNSLNGSSVNQYNHWIEIQAFDRWGRNVAFAADGSLPANSHIGGGMWNKSRGGLNQDNTTTYKPMHYITSEVINDGGYLDGAGGVQSAIIDMGIVHYIDTIKMWHYYADGRSYHNNIVEVSVDGVNWVTVFDSAIEGEYAEAAAGHTITFDKLGTLYHASFKKGGETLVQDIIED